MKVIVHKVDGQVVITTPVEANIPTLLEQGFIPGDYVILDKDEVPDGKYFGAFRLNGKTLSVDIEAAKEIRKEQLRQQRDAAFKPLDVEFMRAVEQGNVAVQQAIAAKKQALRDITNSPAFASAKTLADLDAIVLPTTE